MQRTRPDAAPVVWMSAVSIRGPSSEEHEDGHLLANDRETVKLGDEVRYRNSFATRRRGDILLLSNSCRPEYHGPGDGLNVSMLLLTGHGKTYR